MTAGPEPKPHGGLHYGWVIVVAGTLCLFACLGLGRFALGMLLPSMAASLHLSYSQMGAISTANFLGYLGAVLAGGFISKRLGARRVIFFALLVVAASMALVGRAGTFPAVMTLYLLTGAGSGAANVPMMGLVTAWFARRERGRAAGFIVTGSGYAILLSGWAFPAVNRVAGAEGWRLSWLLSATLVLAVAAVCLAALRNSPAELGLRPYGEEAPGTTVRIGLPGASRIGGVIARLGSIYFLFGFTYVIYVTFIVTFLVQEHGYSESVAGRFWSAVGLLSLVSGPVFGALSDRWGRRRALALVFAVQAAAYGLAAAGAGSHALYASVALFGIVAWSIPSIMAALAGDLAGPARAAEVFGVITFVFGIGQIAGPAVAGLLSDAAGSIRPAFALASSMAGAAIVLTLVLGHSEGDSASKDRP